MTRDEIVEVFNNLSPDIEIIKVVLLIDGFEFEWNESEADFTCVVDEISDEEDEQDVRAMQTEEETGQ